jgi:putative restriction endonuclease
MVNLFIANTDNACFDFLASEPNIKEVNFWWPGEMGFRATQPGELLAFRLRSPRNKIGGFGVFSKPFVLTDADLLGKFWPCKWRAIV